MSICFLSPILQSDSLHMPTLIGCYLLKIFLSRSTLAPLRFFSSVATSEKRDYEVVFLFRQVFFNLFLIFFKNKSWLNQPFPTSPAKPIRRRSEIMNERLLIVNSYLAIFLLFPIILCASFDLFFIFNQLWRSHYLMLIFVMIGHDQYR